jgi:hypothetical protein
VDRALVGVDAPAGVRLIEGSRASHLLPRDAAVEAGFVDVRPHGVGEPLRTRLAGEIERFARTLPAGGLDVRVA